MEKYPSTIGKRVRAYTVGEDIIEGIAEDVASNGSLIIRLGNGEKTVVYAENIVRLR